MNISFENELKLPAVAAPMFLISGPQLVIECCKNGIVGTFPALNHRTTEGFEEWVVEIKEALDAFEKETGNKAAPFGVNLIVHPTNPRVQPDLEICIKHKVPIIITSLGAVSDLVSAVHSYGGLVYHDVIKKRHAEKAAEAGVDGLILVAAGAGGHAGALSPLALINEIKSFFKKTILLSGCISTGQDIASALQMGADLAYLGSAFIATSEANADPAYKQALVDYAADDIVYTNLFTGVLGNYLKPSIVAAGMDPDNLPQSDPSKMNFGSGGSSKSKAWKDIWGCGQGINAIKEVVPTADLVERLRREYEAAKKRIL